MQSLELIEIIAPALVAGVMIAVTHAPLGLEVLKRGIIFIDLAVAQVAGLGLVLASHFMHEPSSLIKQLAALSAAITAGLFFRMVERKAPEQQEAIIGCSFVLAGSLIILLLADHPQGGEQIQHLLSGQMLFITWSDVLTHAPIYALILALWFVLPKLRNGIGFYLLFALAITSSVQLVGVYVVFASLILPALAAIKAPSAHKTAWSCGVVAVILGMLGAAMLDLPAGPVIVLSYSLVAAISVFLHYYVCDLRKQ